MIYTHQSRGSPPNTSLQLAGGGNGIFVCVRREVQEGGWKESNVLSPELIFRQCYLFFFFFVNTSIFIILRFPEGFGSEPFNNLTTVLSLCCTATPLGRAGLAALERLITGWVFSFLMPRCAFAQITPFPASGGG